MAGTLFAEAKQKADGLKSAHALHIKRLATKRPRVVEQEAAFEEPPGAGAHAEGDEGAGAVPGGGGAAASGAAGAAAAA
eukprot:4100281-Pyramimonas_sp.AAC.1